MNEEVHFIAHLALENSVFFYYNKIIWYYNFDILHVVRKLYRVNKRTWGHVYGKAEVGWQFQKRILGKSR